MKGTVGTNQGACATGTNYEVGQILSNDWGPEDMDKLCYEFFLCGHSKVSCIQSVPVARPGLAN